MESVMTTNRHASTLFHPLHSNKSEIHPSRSSVVSSSSSSNGQQRSNVGAAATSKVQSPIVFEVSSPVTDVGNKYVQRYGRFTPQNVERTGDRMGVRMEDYCLIAKGNDNNHDTHSSEVSSQSNHANDVVVVVVADGHGSVPAYSSSGRSQDAERFIGGYEVAQLTGNAIGRFVTRVTHFVPVGNLSKEAISQILYDAFAYAQRCCEQETQKGARHANAVNRFDKSRLADLISSAIDGYHFRDLFKSRALSENPWIDTRCLVVDKVLQPYAPTNAPSTTTATTSNNNDSTSGSNTRAQQQQQQHFVTYYVDGLGRHTELAEYGCTATAILMIPLSVTTANNNSSNNSSVGTLYVAHTGDTDAYLFFRAVPASTRYSFVKLTGNHSVENSSEVKRLKPYNMSVNKPYFTLMDGTEAGQSIMPSRALGHSLLSKHGICFEPTITTTKVSAGDILVVATDGLWSSYGRAKNKVIPPPPSHSATTGNDDTLSDEDLSAVRVAELLHTYHDRSPTAIGVAIKEDVAKYVSVRDNMAIVVMRVLSQ